MLRFIKEYRRRKMIDKKLMERKLQEESKCLERLSEFVQDRIVPSDPVFYIAHCKTIDVAIEYYINILEHEVKTLRQLEK